MLKSPVARVSGHVGQFFALILLVALGFGQQAFAGRRQKSRPAPPVVQDTSRASRVEAAAQSGEDKTKVDPPPAQTSYKRPSGATTVEQRAAVQGQPCVDCGKTTPRQVADHKTPLVKEYYETGQIDKQRMKEVDAVQPQCPTCSGKQGADLSRYSKDQKKARGLK
jgi:hypothetical protein